ncbi:hypothetical protein N7489_009128 [Penicillium chrysogenum]|uniref:Aminoglycoside phosphotransferase domain-containing protein n=1 Tax=Penicillium chrysogenum TaxID=5076 RepID=A0ABQ8WYF1_PENCH|nr:uncharacterized protein N7489_009128 [Penicillium chrysogenum]KAJ5228420.1 hypothetical protein N7489_009128 [Penicillium chrysogenum]KAJ5257819.1 hypothetical protein N7524_009375 [Penicillium chrysogenum]KAJ5283946.1 hypothetical protein N7505_001926 [Penicillium chrysogenum]KAJ6167935.1 hypothetical protein N7497_000778 [Penicillium chrysogenum]
MVALLDILSEASYLRLGVPCSFVDESPRQGGSHTVFKIVFEDSVEWAARVGHDPNNWENELRAVKTFQCLKQQCTAIRAPTLLYSSKHPVLYSEWVNGAPLAIWNLQVPQVQREALLDDMADFLLQVWTARAPPDLTVAQPTLYSHWLTESLDRALRRTLNGTAKWGDAVNYLIMRSMIPGYAIQFDQYTGIAFAHGDLRAHNIMKSDTFRLTGVIDWDWMYMAPLPAAIHHPWFIADTPGWNNDGVRVGETFGEDRAYLEAAIERLERLRGLPHTVSALLRGSGERLLFQSAFHFQGIHERFVEANCHWTERHLKSARSELDTVLHLYPDLGEKSGA